MVVTQTINGVSKEFKISDKCKYCNKKINFTKEMFTIVDLDGYHEECEYLAFPIEDEGEESTVGEFF